jgi:hypothetical protein
VNVVPFVKREPPVSLPSLDNAGVVADLIACIRNRRPDTDRAAITWSALAICGALLGTRVFAMPWRRALYPNLYLVIVAPTGSGKGDLFGDCEDIFDAVDPGHLLADRFTTAGYSKDIAEKGGYGLQVVDEGDELFRRMKQDAFADIMGILCRAYDGRMAREALVSREAATVRVIAPTLLFAIQPSALTDGVISAGHALSGFLGRCVVVRMPRPDRRVVVNEGDGTPAAVVVELRALSRITGQARLPATVQPILERLRDRMADERPDDPNLEGTWSRVSALAVKLATILTASEMVRDRLEGPICPVSVPAMKQAAVLALCAWQEAEQTFSEDVAFSRDDAQEQKVMRAVRAHGPGDVPRHVALKATKLSAQDFDKAIRTLVERRDLLTRQITTTGRPGTVYWLGQEAGLER